MLSVGIPASMLAARLVKGLLFGVGATDPVTYVGVALFLGAVATVACVLPAYRAARTGILTGILLAVARISGETAPLLFTALNNQFWSTNLNAPMANLPVVIFQFAMSPYEDWHRLAWGGATLITLTVLVLNILARVVIRKPA